MRKLLTLVVVLTLLGCTDEPELTAPSITPSLGQAPFIVIRTINVGLAADLQSSFLFGVNDLGQVAGEYEGGGFFFPSRQPGRVARINFGVRTQAWDINNAGQVPGSFRDPAIQASRPFVWTEEGGKVDLPLFECGGDHGDRLKCPAFPFAINELGVIVGQGQMTDANASRAAIWENGVGEWLGPAPGQNCFIEIGGQGNEECGSRARDINDLGQVVGWTSLSSCPSCGRRPFIWTREAGMQVLETGGAAIEGIAAAINNNGDVVGRSFLWRGGTGTPTIISLSPIGLSTSLTDINDDGIVAGRFTYQHLGESLCCVIDLSKPFVWTETTGAFELPILEGYNSAVVWAISEKIPGNRYYVAGGVLLRDTDDSTPDPLTAMIWVIKGG